MQLETWCQGKTGTVMQSGLHRKFGWLVSEEEVCEEAVRLLDLVVNDPIS